MTVEEFYNLVDTLLPDPLAGAIDAADLRNILKQVGYELFTKSIEIENGWTPILGLVADGNRLVVQVKDWTGGTGTPPASGQYIGSTGYVTNISLAANIRGIQGLASWTPILAAAVDGERRVFQVVDWVGGQGTKPTTGQYIGASGLTSTLSQAVDVRGLQGLQAWSPAVANISDGERIVQQVIDWFGGQGTKPSLTPALYISSTGFTSNIASATNIRGIQGLAAWTPVLGITIDGVRRVFRVTDWTGGQGTKPATGQYLSETGFTSTLASAVDVRGPQGLFTDMTRTSTDNRTVGLGNLTFTFSESLNLGWTLGMRLRASVNGTPGVWVEGVISAVSSTSVTLAIDQFSGSGSYSNWSIGVAGQIGPQGILSPAFIADNTSYTVPDSYQQSSNMNLIVDGTLIIDGYLADL